MDERAFLNLVLQLAPQLAGAVSTGAQWEVLAQTLIGSKLLEAYGVIGREIPYPGTRESADIGFSYEGKHYLIELKVESATNAGQFAGKSLLTAVSSDVEKLRTYTDPRHTLVRWVLCIAYSRASKEKMREMLDDGMFTALDEENPMMAAIVDVDRV